MIALDNTEPAKFDKGHYRSLSSDMSRAGTGRVLAALDGSPALDIFKARRITKITLARMMQEGINGFYEPLTGVVHVGTARRAESYGRPFEPGTSWSVSSAGSDKFDAMGRTLIHESGHHLQAIGGSDVSKIAATAFRNSYARPITQYGKRSASEYVAETWAAYHAEMDKLRSFDPVGVKMMGDIVQKLREMLKI